MKSLFLILALAHHANAFDITAEVRTPLGEGLNVQSSSGVVINPSTEDTLIDVLRELQAILIRQNDRTQKVRLTDGERDSTIAFSGFDSLKVAAETQVFEEGFAAGLDTVETWDQTTSSGGLVTVVDSQGLFQTFADGDISRIRTKASHQFLHGFSNTWRIRVRINKVNGSLGSTREWGLFDDANGYFFRVDNDGLSVVIRRKTLETVVSSSSFVNSISLSTTGQSYAIQYLNGNRVLFYINGVLAFQSGSSIANLIANSQLRTTINNVQVSSTTGEQLIEIYGLAVVRDGTPFTYDSAGRVRVSGGVAEAPPGTLSVNEPATPKITLNPGQTIDEFYTITDGKSLTLQVLDASVESAGTGKSVVIELFDDPNGDASSLIIIPGGILMGNNFNSQRVIDKIFLGDGTRRILLRTTQVGNAQILLSRTWMGFEQ